MSEDLDFSLIANGFEALPRPVKTYHGKPYPRIAPTNFKGAGKTVLITAGATGIGFSIAEAFAESGVARLALLQRTAEKLEKAKKELQAKYPKVEVLTYAGSIDDYARTEEVLKDLGTVDILVLSATAVHSMLSFAKLPTKEIEDIYHTNVPAQYNFVQSYIRLPPTPGHSKTILNISSGAAHLPVANQIGYGPSKAAFVETLQHVAGEFTPAKDNVRIFSYHPGAFYTKLVESASFPPDALPWEDIALPGHFATWLASDEATFLHGRFVWAHWDVDELLGLKERLEKDPYFLTIGLVL